MARAGIPAEADPRKTSPKVKWGAYTVGVLTVIASAIAAIPQETWAALGEFGLPTGLAIGGVASYVAGYLKSDPAREPNPVTETVVAPPVQQDSEGLVLLDPADLVLREDEAVVETTDPVLPGARLSMKGEDDAGVYVYGDESVGVPVRRVASKDPFEELRRRLDS